MTLLSRICFSVLAGLPLWAGAVAGSVELRDSRQASVRSGKDYSGVIVWLEAAPAPALAPPAKHARMAQKDKTFLPHVLAVQVGTTVDFPNFDPIFHNAFSTYDGQVFDVGLYPPGTSQGVRFARPGVVRVFCNIHAAMSAVIVVVATPYFDTTSKSGAFLLPDAPPGEYVLHVFHERATPATLKALERSVTVRGEPVKLPPLTISESGYLALPHQNKYGREYPPAPDDGGVYPAVRK